MPALPSTVSGSAGASSGLGGEQTALFAYSFPSGSLGVPCNYPFFTLSVG